MPTPNTGLLRLTPSEARRAHDHPSRPADSAGSAAFAGEPSPAPAGSVQSPRAPAGSYWGKTLDGQTHPTGDRPHGHRRTDGRQPRECRQEHRPENAAGQGQGTAQRPEAWPPGQDHGRHACLPHEDPRQLEERIEAWLGDWEPTNALERELVRRAARLSWLLERGERFEATHLAHRVRLAGHRPGRRPPPGG